ncbi:GNAT family N-acetyltransferase [Pseudonocardiaceae bacterium YIM PH 21723]|nr:GNAT family N-acetyltransferase [Pseudonocardiaceae bacterium YIM PH 21723]
MNIRSATERDWPQVWEFLRVIAKEGETYCWDRDLAEEKAYAWWWRPLPVRTVVAVDGDTVLGTAVSYPNQSGPGAHVASASFLVDPAFRGVGRALGNHVVDQARADGFRAMQFNAVVETNTRAVALWESLGFRVLGTVPEAFHSPAAGYVGLHIMYRSLL